MNKKKMGTSSADRPDTNANSKVRPDFDPYNGKEPYIFISYAHADNDVVNALMNSLTKEKFRLWYDAGLEIGNDFRAELEEKIRDCDVMIFFASERSFASKYCSTEVINAVKYNKRIYPFFLGEPGSVVIPSQLEMILGNTHHIYYDNTPKSLKTLMNSLPIQTIHALEINADGVVVSCKDGNKEITIPDYYNNIKVTEIGDEAFKFCQTLEYVHLGANIKKLGSGAFRGSANLKKMVLPQRLDSVGENAFRDCVGLEEVIIEGNTDIFDRAFENCPSLKTLVFPSDFSEVNNAVFNSCKGLTKLDLPDSVIMIGESAFSDCDKLEKIEIPAETIKINDFAFANCKSVKEVKFNNVVKKIGKNAFQNCYALENINIPRSVTMIECGALKGCKNLERIEVDPKNRHYRSFNNVLFTKNKSELIVYAPNLKEEAYEVPDSVMKICAHAFYGCTNLKTITIPDSVQEIGEGAFYACTNIETIIIPDSVEFVEDFCFRNCTNLRRVEFPDSVREIGWGLFRGCSYGQWKKDSFELTVICSKTSPMASFCIERGIKCLFRDHV